MVNQIADLLKKFNAIELGDFTLASGEKSSYYIDVKSSVTNPELLSTIVSTIVQTQDFDVAAGVAIGGVPFAVATALISKKPYAIIRAAKKGHGKKDVIIGSVRGKNVLLIEDVTTSGGSALYGVEVLREAGARINRVVTVVDREQGASEILTRQGVVLIPLVRVSELL
jgi:orotate phosphoribosyltransferase